MKTTLKTLALAVALGAAAVAGVVWSGLVSVAADEPHSAPVLALLETARERSIAMRARLICRRPSCSLRAERSSRIGIVSWSHGCRSRVTTTSASVDSHSGRAANPTLPSSTAGLRFSLCRSRIARTSAARGPKNQTVSRKADQMVMRMAQRAARPSLRSLSGCTPPTWR